MQGRGQVDCHKDLEGVHWHLAPGTSHAKHPAKAIITPEEHCMIQSLIVSSYKNVSKSILSFEVL